MQHTITKRFPSLIAAAIAVSVLSGCAYQVEWPDRPSGLERDDGGQLRRYAIDSGGMINYIQRMKDGCVARIEFDDDSDGVADEVVDFASAHDDWPHFLIVLDGVPFSVVEELYEAGRFRLFEPPRKVVTVYPAMTDLALSCLFGTPPCVAYEALHFDRALNKITGGNSDYLEGKNAPWIGDVDYAAPQDVAVGTYLNPHSVFDREIREMARLFREHPGPFAAAYSVGTAGLGTRGGEAAIRSYLITIDRLCERITYERRGKVRFSIAADHGHGLEPCRRVSMKDVLREKGFRVTESLDGPKDVVQPEYGLVTFAQFFTNSPAEVAAVLAFHPAADVVSYVDHDCVVVLKQDKRAEIQKGVDGFVYRATQGDPLEIQPLIATMREAGLVNDRDEIDDAQFLSMSVDAHYPDALRRLWGCHHDLVQQPADVVVSMKPGFCAGSKFFDFFVGPVASTHGALDHPSSVTFLLTNRPMDATAQVFRLKDVIGSIRRR